MISPEQKHEVIRGMQYLAGRCDGAVTEDGIGFNGTDTKYGHTMAAIPPEAWNDGVTKRAAVTLIKYKKQLEGVVDYDAIVAVAHTDTQEDIYRFIDASDDAFLVRFSYSQDLVGKLHAAVIGKWDRENKTWRVSADQARPLKLFAQEQKFDITPAAQALMEKCAEQKPAVSPYRIEVEGAFFRIIFPYNPALVAAVKEIHSRKFDSSLKLWRTTMEPMACVHLNNFLQAHPEFVVSPEARQELDNVQGKIDEWHAEQERIKQQKAKNLEAAKAVDAEVSIPGLGGELRPFQRAGVAYAVANKRVFIGDEMGLGKGQIHGSLVLTSVGWQKIETLEAGQRVIGRDGLPHHVVGVYPRGRLPVYKVSFNDGTSLTVDEEHLWTVQHVRNDGPLRYPKTDGKWRTISTAELMGKVRDRANNANWRVPLPEPVRFSIENDASLLIEPYALGLLLGDGGLSQRIIYTSADHELIAAISLALPCDVALRHIGRYDYAIRGKRGVENSFAKALRALGLKGKKSSAKFIPECYLFASPTARLAILQGLMDTDGEARRDGCVLFSSMSAQLTQDVAFLVRSLGGIARIRRKKAAYEITVVMPRGVVPFRLSRKAERASKRIKYPPTKIITAIEYAGEAEVTCIAVNAVDKLYVAEHFTVTHNTVQALATVQAENAYPALIVSPASLKLNWQREARKWLPGKSVRVLQSRSAFYDGDIVIANYDILGRHIQGLQHRGFKSFIFDESHYLKNHKAKRTEIAQELVKDADIILCLTGTPVMNRPQELVSQLKILGRLDEFGGWYNFVRRYCNAYKDSYGWNISGAAHLEELNDKLREVCFIRRLKADVLKELPAKQRSEIMIELSNREEYSIAEADVVNWIKQRVKADADFKRQIEDLTPEIQETIIANRADAKAASAAQAETLVRIEALKQLSAEGKMEAVVEWIEDFIDSGEKLVVFATHKSIVQRLADKFGADSITGDTPIEKRQAAVDRFQNDPSAKVIVCNIQAGGVGLTLTAASNVAFVELGWNPAAHDQAEDRCHRIGQTDSVTAYYFIGQDSIDEWIYDLIEEKRVVVDATTDGVVREKRSVGMLKDLVKKLSAKGEPQQPEDEKPLYKEMTEILNQESSA